MIIIYTQDETYIRDDADSAKDVLITVYGEKLGAEAYAAVKNAQKKGTVKKLSEGVTLTNGMIALGKTAVGIATKNPAIALPAALEMVKEVAK